MIGKEIPPYRIIEKIGQGGMGIVYKGLHVKLDQEVAIKVLSPEFSQDPNMRERFIREAKIQAKISHPNVVNILNYVEDDADLFLVMEYIRGETLDNRLRRMGRLDDATGVCISVLSALEYMHSRGIVHRDIKPGNIMFLEDGSVKVMDFGIAKMAGEKGQTKTGMKLGTLWYMSPEQVQGEEATVASDIYAVGITLYQMVTGRVPFSGDSEYKVMKAHLEEKPVPPWEINENVPENLGRIVLKAIAKEKKERFQSAREFADALKNNGKQAPESSVVSGAVNAVKAVNLPKISMPEIQLDRKYLLIILLCIGALLIVIGLFMGLRGKRQNPIPVVKESPPLTAPSMNRPSPTAVLPAEPGNTRTVPVDDGVVGEEKKKSLTEQKKTRPGLSKKNIPAQGDRRKSTGKSVEEDEKGEWKIND